MTCRSKAIDLPPRSLEDAFNEWMRAYIEQPESFDREWQNVALFVSEESQGGAASYGAKCAELLRRLMDGRHVFGEAPPPMPLPSAGSES